MCGIPVSVRQSCSSAWRREAGSSGQRRQRVWLPGRPSAGQAMRGSGQARVRPSAGQAKRGPGGRVPSMTRHGVWLWGHVGSCAEHDTQQLRGRAAQQLLERAVLRALQEPHAPVRGEARACEQQACLGSASLGFKDCVAYASSAARTTTASRRWTGSLVLSMAYEAGVGLPPAPAAGPDSSAKSPIARRHVSPRWDELVIASAASSGAELCARVGVNVRTAFKSGRWTVCVHVWSRTCLPGFR